MFLSDFIFYFKKYIIPLLKLCYGIVTVTASFLFGIYASLQNAYVGEISVLFIVIETVADNELILDDLAAIVGGKGNLAAGGLIEKRAGLYAVGVSVF